MVKQILFTTPLTYQAHVPDACGSMNLKMFELAEVFAFRSSKKMRDLIDHQRALVVLLILLVFHRKTLVKRRQLIRECRRVGLRIKTDKKRVDPVA